jgi:hypothetical protein
MTCDNCGKTDCNCDKYEDEIEKMKSQQIHITYDDKMNKIEETVKRWEEKK